MNKEKQRRPDEPAGLGLDGLLNMFPSFDKGVVEMAYDNHNHSYERTYAHLIEMDAQIENNINNDGAAEARFSRSDDAPDQGMAKLQAMYPHIDAEHIKFTYNESGRSVEEAAKQLLDMIEVEEESRAKRLRQMADDDLIVEWLNAEERPEPFQAVIKRICVAVKLMGSSVLDDKIETLRRMVASGLGESIQDTVARLVAKGFDLDCTSHARQFIGNVAGSEGKIYDGCIIIYNDLSKWQRPLFQAALKRTISQDNDSIKVLCGIILDSAPRCKAAKLFAFWKIVDRSVTVEILGKYKSDHNDVIGEAKQALLHACHVAIDNLKDAAFKSTFIEPSEFYYHFIGNGLQEGAVNVHGINTYLAVLVATLGVKLAQTPFLADHTTYGTANFKDALDPSDLKKLWDPDNLGKSWKTIFGLDYRPGVNPRVNVPGIFVVTLHTTPREVTTDIIGKPQYHQEALPYLEAFARHFHADFVPEHVCKYLLSLNDIKNHLNAVVGHIAPGEFQDAEGDARLWLWDLMDGNFHQERAIKLLRFIGVCKAE